MELNGIETLMANLGLTTPTLRFLGGFSVTSGALLLLKPQIAFDKEGNARPWKLIEKRPGATPVPWFLPGLAVGGVLALLI